MRRSSLPAVLWLGAIATIVLPVKAIAASSDGAALTFAPVSDAIALPAELEAIAQVPIPLDVPPLPDEPQPIPPDLPPSDTEPLPSEPLQLPPPDTLLQPAPTPAPQPDADVPDRILVERFEVVGSTIFEADELAAVARRAVVPDDEVGDPNETRVGRSLSFAELLQARSAVTEFYTSRGYVTTGALIPPQSIENNVVQIRVVEGELEEINVSGSRRLRSSYVRDRLAIAAATPLNVNQLLEGLQLLQLDPLIESISADLQAGARPGTSILEVQVTEADSFGAQIGTNNGRSPSVGSVRRQAQITQANLLGLGDGLSLGYTNTEGSDGFDIGYSLPLNARNGTLSLAFGTIDSTVIEEPFDELGIDATSRYYELTFRQPIVRSPSQEFALSLTASHQTSQTSLSIDDIGPFPLSAGADEEGRTRLTALRFAQDWTQRTSQHVFAVRSQFSLGLDLLGATINENDVPDSRFLSWRGQAQWVRLLAPDSLLLLRGDVQLADGSLLALEQFGLGGQASVRGYRQDALLTDNGILASAEVRLPIVRVPSIRGLLQVAPFIDVGTAWNVAAEDPEDQFLAGVGLGLLWRQGDRFSARLDWGIPLVSIESRERTWQESGLYFSIDFSPF